MTDGFLDVANGHHLDNLFQINGRNGPNISPGIREMQQSGVETDAYSHRQFGLRLCTSTISIYYDRCIELLQFESKVCSFKRLFTAATWWPWR